MRKLIVAVMVSLRASFKGTVVQTRTAAAASPTVGGRGRTPATNAMDGLFARPFALVLGRRTYDIFASFWPQVASDAPHGHIADAFTGADKHVATHHADTLDWPHSHALGADLADALRELKHGVGPDLVSQGSSNFTHPLLATDIVDELRLLIYPMVLGRGERLFADATQSSALRLASSRATPSGVLVSRYLRDGDVRTGSFASD
ncbi:MAG: dihydrofolate reductase family protein [Dokdonella sp.]